MGLLGDYYVPLRASVFIADKRGENEYAATELNRQGCRVAFGNSAFSFFAGFAVFSIAGYLKHIGSPVSSVSSIGLAFIAYPTAIDMLSASNLWSALLALTLFTLGLDSAFSLVEAASTVVSDTTEG